MSEQSFSLADDGREHHLGYVVIKTLGLRERMGAQFVELVVELQDDDKRVVHRVAGQSIHAENGRLTLDMPGKS